MGKVNRRKTYKFPASTPCRTPDSDFLIPQNCKRSKYLRFGIKKMSYHETFSPAKVVVDKSE